MIQTSTRTFEVLDQLSTEWAEAELRGDTKFLDEILTDEFVSIGPFGFMLSKSEWIERHKSGDLKYNEFTWSDVEIRPYVDAAVITGRQEVNGSYQSQPTQGNFRCSQFFVKQNGFWRLAALQLSPIQSPPSR
jgi:Domain of unknown function (DUF4440)